MELLTDSETRDFSRFLDSFASSSSGPPPSSSAAVASASSALGFAAPPPPPQAVGSSSRRTLAHGGAATWDLGGWSDPAGQHRAPRLPHPAPPPPPPLLSHRSSSGSSVPLAHRPHGYATASTGPLTSLPRPPHLSSGAPTSHLPVPPSLASHFQHPGLGDATHAEPDASKRARMAQHARDLEAWMGRAPSRPPPGAAGGGDEDDEDDDDEGGREERGLPPLKRARSEDPASARGRRGGAARARRARGGEDPLVAMLEEAERRAGWPGAAAVAGAGPARDPAHALLHAAASAAAAQEEEDEGRREPEWPAVLPPGKRRSAQQAAQVSAPGRKKRAAVSDTALAAAGDGAPAPAPGPSGPPHTVAPTSRAKGGAKKKQATSGAATAVDTPMDDNTSTAASPAPVLPVPPTSLIDNDDPDAPHHNPGPAVTPHNIPRLPARPRKLLGPSRASSTPSESPAPAQGGGKGALLTAEQKKANHIASEQKRRAAIRQGYDGLCEVVPALRAAVQEFEERVRKVTSGAAGGAGAAGGGAEATGADGALDGAKGGKGKKRLGRGLDGQSTTGALMGGIQVGGEKIDGRAGPKSEAVVLGKTVERVRFLLDQRSTLLSRLSDAYALGASHGLDVAPAAGSFGSEWDEKWDESMRAEVLGAGIKDEATDDFGDEDAPGEWDGE
ncbi:hypothetical protein JCM3775_002779 [Rhodotorula graminis]|uniref:BHLH domain-containing protein n=1 Tax=Rhodotorula graminis (strain WP1) TaxID=578459 RepID=A0A0P9F9Q3_RHOGW|nr:uncharacterized protein RHOBADRAFT_55829 [Rhodotorula graminis WP1]KPV72350.1 hypothetical protein RHOBADRAFT_55829 [Rhodotorula graminis WP1]